MQRSRILKEIPHIKGSQINDNQSVVSHSRSAASYQFNHVRFSKIIDPRRNEMKNAFHLETVHKARSKHKERNTDSVIKKTSRQNSLSSLLDKEPIDTTLKKKSNQKLQSKLKKFLENVKNIHNHLKQMAQSMLNTFEKIKEQMQTNLIKVTDEMIRFSGLERSNATVIQQILHQGFQAIRKVISQPIGSLSELHVGHSQGTLGQIQQQQNKKQYNKRTSLRQPPLTPMMKASHQNRRPMDAIYSSAFSTQLISPRCEFKLQRLNLNSVSKSKARAETERLKGEIEVGDSRQQPEQTTERKISERGRELMTRRSTESTHNIDCIISQMRQILNE